MAGQNIPKNLHYTAEHEWVAVTASGTLLVGITDFAQKSLGDVVFVSLPDVGVRVTAGDPIGEVESTKSVADIFAPVTGEVVRSNDTLVAAPETVNSAPFGEGWLVELRPDEEAAFEDLLDATGYLAALSQSE